MTWKHVADCLPAGLRAQIAKGPDAEAPGQVAHIVNETTQPGTMPASRAESTGRPTHSPAPPQRRVGRPVLFVIKGGFGGGRRLEEGEASAAFRAHTGGGGRGRKLMLVVG